MKKFFGEFKEFAMRGNVIDMAVGVVIGAAFKAIIDSLVNNIINPLIGTFFNTDFSDLGYTLVPAEASATGEAVVLGYGMLITAIINFILIAFALFLMVKSINNLHKIGKKQEAEEAPAEPTTKKCPFCCTEIDIAAVKCPHCTSDQPAE